MLVIFLECLVISLYPLRTPFFLNAYHFIEEDDYACYFIDEDKQSVGYDYTKENRGLHGGLPYYPK